MQSIDFCTSRVSFINWTFLLLLAVICNGFWESRQVMLSLNYWCCIIKTIMTHIFTDDFEGFWEHSVWNSWDVFSFLSLHTQLYTGNNVWMDELMNRQQSYNNGNENTACLLGHFADRYCHYTYYYSMDVEAFELVGKTDITPASLNERLTIHRIHRPYWWKGHSALNSQCCLSCSHDRSTDNSLKWNLSVPVMHCCLTATGVNSLQKKQAEITALYSLTMSRWPAPSR